MQGNEITVTKQDVAPYLQNEQGQLLLNILTATDLNLVQKEAYFIFACSNNYPHMRILPDMNTLEAILIQLARLGLQRNGSNSENFEKNEALFVTILTAAKHLHDEIKRPTTLERIGRNLTQNSLRDINNKKIFMEAYLKVCFPEDSQKEFPFVLMALGLDFSEAQNRELFDTQQSTEKEYFEHWFAELLQEQDNTRHSRIVSALSHCFDVKYLHWRQYYIDALAKFLIDNGKIGVKVKGGDRYLRQQNMSDSTTDYANALLRVIKTISDNSNLSEKFTNKRTRQFFMMVMRTFVLSVKLTPEFSPYFINLDKKINGKSLRGYLYSKADDTDNNTTFLARLKFLTNFLTAVLEAQKKFLEQHKVPELVSSNEAKWASEEKPASEITVPKMLRRFSELANSNLDSSVIDLNRQLWQCANAYKDGLSWSIVRSDKLREDYLPEILRVFIERQQLPTDHNTQIAYSNDLLALVQPFAEHGVPKEIRTIFADQLMKLFNTINNLSSRFTDYLNFDRSVLTNDSFNIYLRNKINKLTTQKDPGTFFRQFKALLMMLKLIVEIDQTLQLQDQEHEIFSTFSGFRTAFSSLVDEYKGGVHAGADNKMRTVYLANLGGESPESKLTMGTTSLTLNEILATIEKFSSTQDDVMGALQKAAFVLGFLEQNAISSAFSDYFIALDTLVDGKTLKQYLQEAVGSYWNGYQYLDDVIAMITLVATYANYSAQERENSKATFNEVMEAICGNMDDCGEGLDYFYYGNKMPTVLFEILELDAKNSIQNANELLSILSRIERRLATENPVRLAKLAQFVCAILNNPMVNLLCIQWLKTSLDKAHPDFETATFREYLKIKVNDTASVIKEPYRHLRDVVDFLKLLCNPTQCTRENIKNICDQMSKSGTMETIYLREYFTAMAPTEVENCKLSSDGIELPLASLIRLGGLMPSQADVERHKLIPMFTRDSDQDQNKDARVIEL